MDLEWLQDFVSLANTGSFSKAAEQRHVSQSAFSRRIMALENWLGTTLVDRHTHPVSLTDAGSQLVRTANQVIRTIYRTREDYGGGVAGQGRVLKIGVANHLSIHFVPHWLRKVAPNLKDRKFQFVTGLKAGLGFVELLKEQSLDFLLAYNGSVSREDHDAGLFESVVLGEDVLVPVCRTSFMVGQLYKFPASREYPLPYIGYMPGSALSNKVNRLTSRQGSRVHLKAIIETGTAETIKAFVLGSYGLAWLPRLAILKELGDGVLTVLGDARHLIPFNIELTRCTANSRPDVIITWEKLKVRMKHVASTGNAVTGTGTTG
jgi:DNA-binding transcriptional LysR family regulator